MPETFGSGTAGASYDPRCQPIVIAKAAGLGPGLTTFPGPGPTASWVLTALDVVSYGGGSGGPCYFWMDNASQFFVVFNFGGSSDAFSWRGFLPVSHGTLAAQNGSDTQFSLYMSGLNYLQAF